MFLVIVAFTILHVVADNGKNHYTPTPTPRRKSKKEEEVERRTDTHTWAVHGIYWSGSKQEGDC